MILFIGTSVLEILSNFSNEYRSLPPSNLDGRQSQTTSGYSGTKIARSKKYIHIKLLIYRERPLRRFLQEAKFLKRVFHQSFFDKTLQD